MTERGKHIEDAELKVFLNGLPVEGGRREEEEQDDDGGD